MCKISVERIGNRPVTRNVVLVGFALLVLAITSAPARALDLVWERTWGGPGDEVGEGVAVAPDGSVYLTGQTNSFGTGVADGDRDILLIKYSRAGAILWQRTYGNARTEPFLSASENAADVEVGSDGSVYVAGSSNAGVLLVKFDPDGNVIWEQTVAFGNGSPFARGMALAPDGSIYVAGSVFPGAAGGDAFLLKFAPDGTPIWQRLWGGNNFDSADDVAVASDGTLYLAGDTNSFFRNDAFLVKFSADGTVIWERDWQEGGSQDLSASHGVAVGPDQSVYITGSSALDLVGPNAFLLKFTPAGGLVWEKTWGARQDGALGIAVAPDGIVYITGSTGFGAGGGDAFVVEFLPSGRARMAATWGGTDNEFASDIAVGADGNLYVAAATFSPPPYGFGSAPKRTRNPTSTLSVVTGTVTTAVPAFGDPNGIVLTPDGSQTFAGNTDAALLRIAPRGASTALLASSAPASLGAPALVSQARNYPNPFALKTDVSFRLGREENVSIVVLDVRGRLVKTLASGTLPAGEHRISWDGRNENRAEVASGMYFYRIKAGDAGETRKMILLRR